MNRKNEAEAGLGAAIYIKPDYIEELTKHGTLFIFFFQAEDGIRDADVTGVQTCGLPISRRTRRRARLRHGPAARGDRRAREGRDRPRAAGAAGAARVGADGVERGRAP